MHHGSHDDSGGFGSSSNNACNLQDYSISLTTQSWCPVRVSFGVSWRYLLTAGYTTKKFSLQGTVYGGADAFDFNNISIDGIIDPNMSVLVKNIIGWYFSWHHSALTCMLSLIGRRSSLQELCLCSSCIYRNVLFKIALQFISEDLETRPAM